MSNRFEPDQAVLQQVLNLLKHSHRPTGTVEEKAKILADLDYASTQPEATLYLAYIFQRLPNDEPTNASAGLTLKNFIRKSYQLYPPNIRDYLKVIAIQCLANTIPTVRLITGTIIAQMCVSGGLSQWPEAVPRLVGAVHNAGALCQEVTALNGGSVATADEVQEAALNSLQKVCEDCIDELDQNADLLSSLIGMWLPFFQHPSPRIRTIALVTTNSLILGKSSAIATHLDNYIAALFSLGQDGNSSVRQNVCKAIVQLMDVCIERIIPQMGAIIEFMLGCTKQEDEDIALEACEFWLTLAEQESCRGLLSQALPNVLPVLLSRMQYLDFDLQAFNTEDDAHIQDLQSDIKPRTAHAKTHAQDDDEDDDDDDDDDDNDMIGEQWNLRKCSAAALDIISTVYGDNILQFVLPAVSAMLQSANWKELEAGILALGAIAEGCMTGVSAHLPQLAPFMINCLSHSQALVRSITCWALSRYAQWLVQNGSLPSLLSALLPLMLDNNKRVQQAACSAFATFEEEAQDKLVPFLPNIIGTLCNAMTKYQHKNLLILYDAIGAFADAVGHNLNHPNFVNSLMPLLIEKLQSLNDLDSDFYPLLECLSQVATALGPAFMPFAPLIFGRCITLIHSGLFQAQHVHNPDFDFVVVSLDLISSIAESLGPAVESLVSKSNILELLYQCMSIQASSDVRQSSFALLGDLAKTCFVHVQPYIDRFLGLLLNNLDTQYTPVCNNAMWSLGEIALQLGAGMQASVKNFLPPLIDIINKPDLPKTLLENTGITFGRLGFASPAEIAQVLPMFLQPWCKILRNIRDNEEKESAFRGICLVISYNPNSIVPHFLYLCDAFNSWQTIPPSLQPTFSEILHSFKQNAGDHWPGYFHAFPADLKHSLTMKFGL